MVEYHHLRSARRGGRCPGSALAAPRLALAQTPGRIYRLGIVIPATRESICVSGPGFGKAVLGSCDWQGTI